MDEIGAELDRLAPIIVNNQLTAMRPADRKAADDLRADMIEPGALDPQLQSL